MFDEEPREQTYGYDDWRQDQMAEEGAGLLLAGCQHVPGAVLSDDEDASLRRCLLCGDEYLVCNLF